jgi:hypothetical protein
VIKIKGIFGAHELHLKAAMIQANWPLRFLCLPIIALFVLGSCRKCKEGCDTFFVVDGAALKISDSIVSLNKAVATTTIAVEKIVVKTKGDRECSYENEVSCIVDGLALENLSIYCNKTLVLNGLTYPMNTDLLEVPDLIQIATGSSGTFPVVVLQTTPDFPAGRYHFLLQGKTNEGKVIEDMEVISWE